MSPNAIDISRRNLVKGRIGKLADSEIRPPWAVAGGFEDLCSRCDRCRERCETRIIVAGDGGFPVIDFQRGECSFCGDCAEVCEPGALDRSQVRPWRIKVEVSAAACLSERGISCRSCGDVCDPRAIRFQLLTGGRARLELQAGYCTGCGACISVCPVNAIQVVQPMAVTDQQKQLEGAA